MKTQNIKKKKSCNIINIIQYIIIFILIAFIAYFSYQKFILNKRYVPFFNHNFFIILSGSMEPTINTNDLIVTSQKNVYEKNDIVAFSSGNYITVHRIVDVKNDTSGTKFITKGDSNNTTDLEELDPNDIIGVYKFTIPILGNIFIFLYTYPIFLIILIVVLILIYLIIKFIQKRNKEN